MPPATCTLCHNAAAAAAAAAAMLARSPAKANEDVRGSLSESQRASLQQAVELGQRYAANPVTAASSEHLIGLVKQVRGVSKRLLCFGMQFMKGLWGFVLHPTN
jgi:hypothetical protein